MEENQKIGHLSTATWVVSIVLFGFLLRLVIGATYHNVLDLNPYNIPWAMGVRENLWGAYQTIENLDYPPLFPSLLWFISGGVAYGIEQELYWVQMLFIKLIPILFDTVLIVVLFFVGRRFSREMGLLLATVWALNVSAIFNCAFWGQTDCMMLLFILLMVLGFAEKMPVLATVCFAVGCLAKLQMLYFAPLILLELFFHYRWTAALRALGIGVLVGLAGWIPFMIGAGNWMLPFDIYFGGFGSYNYLNLNAFNVYGVLGCNWDNADLSILGGAYDAEAGANLGGFTFNHFSMVLTFLLLAVVVWSHLYAKRKHCTIPFALNALFWMNGIFMLTTKMHERYQMPALMLVLLCFILCRQSAYLKAFLVLSVITFLNQALLTFQYFWGDLGVSLFTNGQHIFSVCNVLLWLWLILQYKQYHVEAADRAHRGVPLECGLPKAVKE